MSLPETMKAVVIDRFGGPDVMAIEDVPVPRPEAGQILVRTAAAGVGVWDPMVREGAFAEMMPGGGGGFPYTLGSDGAGVVVAVGEGVEGVGKGDRVWGMAFLTGRGFYAEYTPVSVQDAGFLPKGLPMDQAGGLPILAMTAYDGLHTQLSAQPNETIAILGASGAVGHVAVQFAKRMGLRVLAIASGEDGVALVQHLGADLAIDGKTADVKTEISAFAPAGLDAALLLTAAGAGEVTTNLREGGRFAYPQGVQIPESIAELGQVYSAEPTPKKFSRVNDLIESGPFEVSIARAFPLDRVADAMSALEGHTVGRTILRL